MSHATPLQSDLTTWSNLRTRKRDSAPLRGLDAMMNRWGSRIRHARINVKYLRGQAEMVLAQKKDWENHSDAALDAKVTDLREVFARRTHTEEHIRTGFAAIREIARRETGQEPFMVQIMGAMAMFHGQIVEMVTGEGKTLTASVAASALAWLRKPVHVITVNDYLAQRDADSRAPIFRRCGIRAGSIINETPEPARVGIYQTPIVYLTQKELVADWLRDQLKLGRIYDPVSTRWLQESLGVSLSSGPGGAKRSVNVLVPGLHIAIVDELDAVLIDEAVTPLIIAQPRQEDAQAGLYKRARDMARELKERQHFTVDHSQRRVLMTNEGRDKLESLLTPDEHAIWRAARRREELVIQALTAEHCYQLRQHYHIVEDKVVIVDEYTGRFMHDRQWQHGLHQAVEAKHDVEVTADRDTLASLSFQRFFKMYPHLCGMTGTAADAKAELETTYGLPVRIIPTNRPIQRKQLPARIYSTSELRWRAVADEIEEMHRKGRPVLVGTRSIEASELLSEMLKERGLNHQVLNAVHHKAEAQIVSMAGEPGAITVATNMAGRGTDIQLGKGVADAGGLHVILTERHTARRVDRQLYGRAGRQGDPGSARAIIALDDDLLIKFGGIAAKMLLRTNRSRTSPLPNRYMRLFDAAQWRAQRQAFKSRASVLKHDEELDKMLPR